MARVVLQALLVLVLVLLFEAVPEELIFRGYLFALLGERLPTWAVVILQAIAFCLFGAVIGAAVTVERQVAFLLFSIALGIIRAVTGSVYTTIGFHATFQLLSQLTLNPEWTSVQLEDPDAWFSDIAFGLAPLVISPLIVLAVVLLRRRGA
jgi:membrane protease YdiL (CAAX protease family)